MKKYSVTRMIGEKMNGTIRRNRIIPKASPSISRAKQTAVKIKEMIQAIYRSAKTVLTGAMAGGWLAVMLIVMVSMVGALANTPLGLFFSGMYLTCGSIVPCMVLHFLHDVLAMLFLGINDSGAVTEAMTASSMAEEVITDALLLAMAILLFRPGNYEKIRGVWNRKWHSDKAEDLAEKTD